MALRIANRANTSSVTSERCASEQVFQIFVDSFFFDDEFFDALQFCVHV